MDINEVKHILCARVWTKEELEGQVFDACGCDLMSDVLAFTQGKVLLLTGLVNLQVIRTAEMLDIKTVVFVRGKEPSEDMIELAMKKHINILSTTYTLYKACGELYKAGLTGGEGEA